MAAARRPVDDRAVVGGAALRSLARRGGRVAQARAGRARAGRARRERLARDHTVPDQRLSPARDAARAGVLDLPGAERPHVRDRRGQAGDLVLQPRHAEPPGGRGRAPHLPAALLPLARLAPTAWGAARVRELPPRRGAPVRARGELPAHRWGAVRAEGGLARTLPDRALLPLRARRTRSSQGGDPPPTLGASPGADGDRDQHDAP